MPLRFVDLPIPEAQQKRLAYIAFGIMMGEATLAEKLELIEACEAIANPPAELPLYITSMRACYKRDLECESNQRG